MDIDHLLELNKEGFIPGPDETEEAFLERVDYCKNISSYLDQELEGEESSHLALEEVSSRLEECYGFTLRWPPVLYSNKDLSFWHGGCAWIFQKEPNAPKGCFFQLRRAFSNKERVWGYSKEEILVHEAAHAARMDFEEPLFEEFLAYRSSKNRFRSYFGPVVIKPWEIILFFISLLIPTFFGMALLFLIPLGLMMYACIRLYRLQEVLNKTFNILAKMTGSKKQANHLVLRLKDKEILDFSKLSVEKIEGIIYSERTSSLRQQLIWAMTTRET